MSESTPAVPVVQRADAAERAERAALLRVEGRSWSDIARIVGYSEGANASRAVRTHYARIPDPDRSSARATLRERAEWLWTRVSEDVEAGRSGATRAGVALLQERGGHSTTQAAMVYQRVAQSRRAEVARALDGVLNARFEGSSGTQVARATISGGTAIPSDR